MALPILPPEPIEGEAAEKLLADLEKSLPPAVLSREIELAKRHIAEVTAPKAAPAPRPAKAAPFTTVPKSEGDTFNLTETGLSLVGEISVSAFAM